METRSTKVALRKESVDRNFGVAIVVTSCVKSLSARRAWIEIKTSRQMNRPQHVALRKESVDRNFIWSHTAPYLDKSLSARRAWIEIFAKLPIWET